MMIDGAERNEIVAVSSPHESMTGLIHVVRDQQVMLDSDLAELYGVETKRLNESVRRNQNRFPEEFCFQLTKEEFAILRSQIATSNQSDPRGGRRYRPRVFTEQGIAMLSAVLHSDTAIEVSVRIMQAFVEMRRFLVSNAQLFEQVREMDVRQRIDQERNEERFDKIFGYIESHAESEQMIFFDGQVYDAFELLSEIVGKAEREIVLVDGYVDLGTLNILKRKRDGVSVTVWAKKKGDKLSEADVATFEAQYGPFELRHTEAFHDRFLILDGTTGYHIGASLKDAGKKCFGINRLEDSAAIEGVLTRLKV